MITTQVGRMLDDEHRAALDLLGRVEQAVSRAPHYDDALRKLLYEFAGAVASDIQRHFHFEEAHVFPRLAGAGDEGIVSLMLEEHDAIREVAEELLPVVHDALRSAPDAQAWDRLRMGVLELVEREVSHIQKETVAVLPQLEDLLDPELDAELALDYASA